MVSAYPKIETTKFNFVSIQGQYFLAIAARTPDSNKVVNFLSHEADLISYVDVVRCGFRLPAVEIIFSFSDKNLFSYLSEKSIFTVSIGKDLDSQIQSTFNIISSNVKQEVEGKWLARIVGIYDTLPYLKTKKKRVLSNYSSEVAKEILQENLGKPVKCSNTFKSKDFMYWIQPNETDYMFLHTLWLHSYIPDSIWLTAIDFEGTPYITDLRRQAKNQPDIMLTTGDSSASNVYTILDSFDVNNNSAAYNSLGGYATSKPIYNLDESRRITAQKKENVLLSNSNSFNKSSEGATESSYAIQNSNVHSNFQSAPLNNRSFINNLKSFQLDVTAEGKFVPVKILDYVVLKDAQPNGQAQEDYSGIYLVGKIAHQIANKRIYTHITLWRECQNTIISAKPEEIVKDSEIVVSNYQEKVDSIDTLITPDIYASLMQGYAKLDEKLYQIENSIRTKISDTQVYKAFKELDKKYSSLKSYISELYFISSTITENIPAMDELQNKLNSISVDTPLSEVNSLVSKYLDYRKYTAELESKISDKINSNGVYNGYLDVKSKLGQMDYTISQLQSVGYIGDLNEYFET